MSANEEILNRTPTIEQGILYLLWQYPNHKLVEPYLNRLKPDYFLDMVNQNIYDQILKWQANGKGQDALLFSIENKNDFALIWMQCEKYGVAEGMFESYVSQIQSTHAEYSTFVLAEELKTLSGEDRNKRIKEHIQKLDEVEKVEMAKVFSSADFAMEFIAELERRRGMTEPELKSGFKKLDSLLWGLHRGELITVGARTRKGKSTFLLNISANLVRNEKKVLYFSTEMSVHEKWGRLVSNLTGINSYKFRKAEFSNDEWDRIGEIVEKLHDKNAFFVCDMAAPSITDVRALVKKIKPDVVVLDYLGQFKLPDEDRKDLQLSEFMRQSKVIAREENVSILIATQLNRMVDNRPQEIPTLADLRDSGGIEEGSDIVALIYDDIKNPSLESECINKILSVEKNRHGECGIVKISFYPQTLKIVESI